MYPIYKNETIELLCGSCISTYVPMVTYSICHNRSLSLTQLS